MRTPIGYCLAWPERRPTPVQPLDLAALGTLTFEQPDRERFPCLALAEAAMRRAGGAPSVLNAANEVAVDAFLNRRLAFPAIWRTVERAMNEVPFVAHPSLDELLEADRLARAAAATAIR